MSRPVKIVLALAGALVAVVVAAMILVVIFVDPNDYKDDISKAVRDKTGRELSFQGDISLSVFPWIGVTTQGVTFSNAPGFGEKPMLKLKSADVSLRLMPLLSGSVALGTVEVDGLEVNLMRNSAGKTNWDDLVSADDGGKTREPEVGEDTGGAGKEGKIDLSIGGLEVNEARVVWDDRKENVRQAVDECDITLGSIEPGSPFDFKIHVKLSSTAPDISADTNIAGRATLDLDRQLYSVKELKLSVDADGKDVPGGSASVIAAADADVNMANGNAELKNLDLDAYGAKVTGDITATGINGKDMKFKTRLNVPAFDLAKTLLALGNPIKTSDPKALTNVGLSLVGSGSTSSVNVESLQVNLDETIAKGSLYFADPDKPNIRCDLKVDKINLDRYLPPKAKSEGGAKEKEKSAKAENSGGKDELIPVDMLRKLTLDADLGVEQLIAGGARLEDVVVKVVSSGGVLKVKPASLKVARGAFASTSTVDVRGAQPVIYLGAKLSGLDGSKLSKQMNGKESFSGIMGFDTDLSTRGNDMKALMANLDGKFGFNARDGYVSGFDILFLAQDAFSVLTGRSKSAESRGKTRFGEASATAKISKGIARNNDLVVKSPLFRAAGNGIMNLKAMTLDYKLDAKIVGTLEGQGGRGQKELVGLTVPLDITGPVADPSIMVNLPRFATALAEGGFGLASDVLKGVGGVVEDIGKNLTGKKSSKDGTSEKSKSPGEAVKKIEDSIKSLF